MKKRVGIVIGFLFLSLGACEGPKEIVKEESLLEIDVETELQKEERKTEINKNQDTFEKILEVEDQGEKKEIGRERETIELYDGERNQMYENDPGEAISLEPGEFLALEEMEQKLLFYEMELSEEVKIRINGKTYGNECDVPYEELRYIRALHVGFDGNTYIGEMIVNQKIAATVLEILQELFVANYPIERMVLVDEYDANDDRSMEANNSSSFNYRNIAATKKKSLHSYGMAVDINPLYNPYIKEINGETVVLPQSAEPYVDRTGDSPYMIQKDDLCYQAFTKRGFTWGGEWKNSKDYQHFEMAMEEIGTP